MPSLLLTFCAKRTNHFWKVYDPGHLIPVGVKERSSQLTAFRHNATRYGNCGSVISAEINGFVTGKNDILI